MPGDLHYLPLCHRDWLSSSGTRRLSPAARGVYMDLICFQFEDGYIPNDKEDLARMVGISESEFVPIWEKLECFFPEVEPGKLANARVALDREEALLKLEKNRENGNKGGRPAKPKQNPTVSKTETQTKPNGYENNNPNVTQTKPIPETETELTSSLRSDVSVRKNKNSILDVAKEKRSVFKPPAALEVESYALEIGLPTSEVERFVDYYQSKGWIVGKAKMKDWRAALRTWRRNFRDFNPRVAPPPKSMADRVKELGGAA